MKLKYDFVIKEVAGKTLAVAVGDSEFNSMIKLNETAKFIFELIINEQADEQGLVAALREKYEIDDTTASNAVNGFVDSLRKNGLLAE